MRFCNIAAGRAALASIAVSAAFVLPVQAAPLFGASDLIVSYSVYQGTASTIAVGQALPGSGAAGAVANGAYPTVFNNASVDGSFGIGSPILLQDVTAPNKITATSTPTLNVTAATGVVTSFPSKSELAVNVSPNGTVTLGGYRAATNALDISNANTPAVQDPTNPDTAAPTFRSVVQINSSGQTAVTDTSNYSGNNIRSALTAPNGTIYTAGNSGNGAKATDSVTTPGSIGAQLLATTGVQVVTPGTGASAPAGLFSGAADGYLLKDNNFRGLTIANNTLYTSKGSGSNGINTVYQVGAAGTLPTGGTTISILPGFPTQAASAQTCTVANCASYFAPFGLFFANPTTLYVADEGNGGTINDTHAGLQKWTLVNGTWMLAYTLQSGLNLYTPYAVEGYPSALNPYNTGLRNLAGRVNADGTVTLYAATSTNSASGDAGADPNSVVSITDLLIATSLPQSESFSIVEGPQYGVVYRGVGIAAASVPEPATLALLGGVLTALATSRRRKAGLTG